jgi:hypothetical protein
MKTNDDTACLAELATKVKEACFLLLMIVTIEQMITWQFLNIFRLIMMTVITTSRP